jgi:adenosylmethionine-8-amino-7-oxononanoate aminotransferase
LKRFDVVGDIRGMGLLIGIEFVRDKATRLPFPRAAGIAGRVAQAAMEAGVVTYPIQGCVDGDLGDHILIAPPFIVGEKEIQLIVGALESAIEKVSE